ncbi:amino acid ABC transporter ATP-binding/permease protein [Sphingomonas fuzhouensis]|uniref:amino acid ABC transporter ATP-binding/permease protein n=1 Tax=Sphingomonas fuzhouensis TaxID=3106033 RepID=UPI002AFEF708|nr:ATP-binding cassette domain-containing protein [Sphingomonas sp. SGZ-02]
MTRFSDLLTGEMRRERLGLIRAGLLAAAVAAATVALLGLSGWFITAAGAAGLAGPVVAQGFNYLLPSAAIRLLAIVRTGARYGERLAGHAAAFAILSRVRPALYRAIAAAPPARALGLTSGEASARLVQDVGAVEMAIARRPARVGAVASVASGAALCWLARPVAALALVLLVMAVLAVAFRLSRSLDEAGRDVQRLQGALRDLLASYLAAAPELRCYAMEETALARIATVDTALAKARRRQMLGFGAIEGVSATATGMAAVGAFLLAWPSGVPLASLAALAGVTAIDGLMPFLRECAARGSTREAEARLADLFMTGDAASAPALPVFGYLPKTSRIAITGPSGAGKTTLVETLLGLRDADRAPAQRRARFAWSPQDAQLLAGTIRDNLRLAHPSADDAAMWEALDDACLAEVVHALPQGLDSWIGEDGTRLSGGERRRLSLARAYLAPAPWLLLDEPTEALDARTERRVIDRLTARLARTGQGLIVVTHRPALLALCPIRHAVGDPADERMIAA